MTEEKRRSSSMTLRFFGLAVILLLLLGLDANCYAALPGFTRTEAPLVAPEQASETLAALAPEVEPRTGSTLFGAAGVDASSASSELAALARGLKNDVDLIYRYVHDHVAYTPIFGSLKGAYGTYLDGSGNDFDQAELLVTLLRAAGYEANYLYGMLRLSSEQLETWLGVSSDANAIGHLLGSAGIPATPYVYPDGSVAYVDIAHVWVQAIIDGSPHVFDPSLKAGTRTAGIDLAAATGYFRSSFLSSALAGASTSATPDSIQNINYTNIAAELSSYATNLINHLKDNFTGAQMKEVIGGLEITPAAEHLRQTAHPDQTSVPTVWTDIPVAYKTTLGIQCPGIDESLFTADIYARRLTLFFNESIQPVLRLNGTQLATGTALPAGSSVTVTLSVDHPYAANGGTYCDDSRPVYISAGGSYVIVNGWGETARGTVERHRSALQAAMRAGDDPDSESVLGETLEMIAFTWLSECGITDQIEDEIAGTFTIHHHMLGMCGQNDAPYIDMPICLVSAVSRDDDSQMETAVFFSSSGHHSAYEWGVIDQMQPYSAVSTVKLIDLANSEGDWLFDADSANFSAITPQLSGYNSYELSSVQSYLSAGYRVLLPDNGDLTQGQWQGVGFLAISPSGNQIGHIISGGFNGGYTDYPGLADYYTATTTDTTGENSGSHTQSKEPIDLVTGDYLYNHEDMAIGSGPYPFSLSLARDYNSSRQDKGPLGYGWRHNLDIKAIADSSGFQGLGEDSAIDAAAMIVELLVASDLLAAGQEMDKVLVATLAHRWGIGQLIDNACRIDRPGDSNTFILLPDGSYNPPPGSSDQLTRNLDGSFHLRTKYGNLINFNTDGLLAQWQDHNSNTVSYAYDGDGRLTDIGNNLGRTFHLAYNADDLITEITDHTGRSTTYTYDGFENLASVTDCNGETTVFSYDGDGRFESIFYPANPANPFVTNNYDVSGRVATQTNAEGAVYNYFFSGFRAEEVDPDGNAEVLRFNSEGAKLYRRDRLGNETRYQYDGEGRLAEIFYPEGNRRQFSYDEKHNVIGKIDLPKPGSPLAATSTTYTYDPLFSRPTTMTDANGHTTTFTYDSNANLQTIVKPTLPTGTPLTTFTHNVRGQITSVIDPEGMQTNYTYDVATGDLLSMVKDAGGSNITVSKVYDALGNVIQITDPRGHTTTYDYDYLRQPIGTTAPAPFLYQTLYTLDADGRLITRQRATGEAADPWEMVTFTYTLGGKKETAIDPMGQITTYVYDARERLVRIINALGQVEELSYDPLDRLVTVRNGLDIISQENSYTPNGQLASFKDANGNLTWYTYDGLDRLSRTSYPDGTYEAFSYDGAGNLTGKTTRAGDTLSYEYDPLNRLVGKHLPGPRDIIYTYDLVGRLTQVAEDGSSYDFTYDSGGRLVETSEPSGRIVSYAFDAAGNREQITWPDTYRIIYSYDSLNRLTTIDDQTATTLASFQYDGLSRRTGVDYANGAGTAYAYDQSSNLISLGHTFTGSTVEFSYTYNEIGNCTGEDVDDVRYLFDPLGTESNDYTANNLNQYTLINGVAITHDANGNLTSDGRNGYSYDAENHLVTAITPDHSAIYHYDPFGRRAATQVDGNETSYLYDRDQVIAEYDNGGQLLRRFIYGSYLDEPVCMQTGGVSYFYHFNALGSVVALSDDAGNEAEIYTYSPFGRVLQSSTLGNPYLYTGRRYDANMELYYYRSRMYNPALGRFLQPDTIGYAGGMNLYAYVLNDPVNYTDAWGLFRFGKRPLNDGQAPWIPIGSANSIDDFFNTEISHEHGFFEDGSEENIGFGPGGRFSEDPTDKGYRYDDKHYDDDLMREALRNIEDGDYSMLGFGEKKKNNCQDWAERLREKYYRLEEEHKTKAK